jgi:hypothetical protein
MIDNLPAYINIVFIITTLLTAYFFYAAAGSSKITLLIILAWLALQGAVGFSKFYTVTDTMPPRLMLLLLPPLVLIIFLFLTESGRRFIDTLDVKALTLLHIVRIPVELVLLWLFYQKMVPELMTFEGRNFDIISGVTAPLVVYFGITRKIMSNKLMIAWHIICIGLLLNIVIIAFLSAPSPFQKFAFDQPNVGILYFPFVWLPGFIVPVVFFSHLAAIRILSRSRK